jgi:hypothetical protein
MRKGEIQTKPGSAIDPEKMAAFNGSGLDAEHGKCGSDGE